MGSRGGLRGSHYSWNGGRVNTPPSRRLDIVLTSNRKLGKGGVELRGAAPEKGRTNTHKKRSHLRRKKKKLSAHFRRGGGGGGDKK